MKENQRAISKCIFGVQKFPHSALIPIDIMATPRHTESFSVRAYSVDGTKRLSIPKLVQFMHETAMQHVLQLQLSVLDLEPMNLAWVLTRIEIKIEQQPFLNQTVQVQTNPSGFERVRTFRDYRMLDQEGQLLASAVSTWFLMDTQTRRIARVPEPIKTKIVDIVQQIDDPIARTPSQNLQIEKTDYQRTFQVGWHDLDFNAHLNNIHYIKWLLDALPEQFLDTHQLRSLDLYYKQECVLNDEVLSEVQFAEKGGSLHRLSKDGKEVASAICKWDASALI